MPFLLQFKFNLVQYKLPFNVTYGKTSPKTRTKVVDIKTATAEGNIASKNIGSDSIAKALHSNKVAIKRCFFSKIGIIL